MKVFFDTHVLVAAVSGSHTKHAQAFPLLERVQSGKDEGFLSAHSLAEMYAVLTRLPAPYRHTPEQALLSIEENILKHFKATALTPGEYAALIRESALAGLQGGVVYDALILKSAAKAGVERVFTFNLKHFQAVAPKGLASVLVSP